MEAWHQTGSALGQSQKSKVRTGAGWGARRGQGWTSGGCSPEGDDDWILKTCTYCDQWQPPWAVHPPGQGAPGAARRSALPALGSHTRRGRSGSGTAQKPTPP